MMSCIWHARRFHSGLVLLWLLLFGASNGQGQPREMSASDLIRFLTYQADRPQRAAVLLGISGCGYVSEDRAASLALVKEGVTAVREIEKALGSIESMGEGSEFALNGAWLLYSYASIKGPDAYPRLRHMAENPRLASFTLALDEALAISFGLTSYVSSTRAPLKVFNCRRTEDPRDAMDRLLLGLLRGDLALVDAAVTERTAALVNPMVRDRTLIAFGGQSGNGSTGAHLALGYRFEVAGPWGKPDELLTDAGATEASLLDSDVVELGVVLTKDSGTPCSRQRVRFVRDDDRNGMARGYLIDEPKPQGLLQAISSCAAGPSLYR